MPYDQVRDIAPVTRIGMTPQHRDRAPFAAGQNDERVDLLRACASRKLSYASGLVGTSPQLSMELIKLIAKIDLVNIPYKNAAQGTTDTIAGQLPVLVSNFPASVAPVQSGRLPCGLQ
jgi:tripartite-type tricarboxylate transporter receptor subunit TctC